MSFDFDVVESRIGTQSIKWDVPGQMEPPGHRQRFLDALSSQDAIISMSVADMDFAAPPVVLSALRARIDHGVLGYTRPGPGYFDAVCDWHGRRLGWQPQPQWIVPCWGTVPAINIAIQQLTAPGDAIVVQPPVFHPLSQSIQFNARRVVTNPLRFVDGRYHMDLDDLRRKVVAERVRMLLLCSPHNPVGRIWSREELHALGRVCAEFGVLVVSDEVHCDLDWSGVPFTTFAAANPDLAEGTIHCHGPSKTFNVAGLKVSTVIIPSERLRGRFVEGLRNLNELFGVGVMGSVALEAAYRHGEPWLRALHAYLRGNFVALDEFFRSHMPGVTWVPADATYLAWIDCRGVGDGAGGLREQLHREARVLVEDGATYGEEGRGFLRINIGCPRSVLLCALQRMHRVISSR